MSSDTHSYARKTKLATYWSILCKMLQQTFTLFVTLYVARLLGPKDFGVMAIGMAVVVYLNSLTSFGMTGAIVNKDKIDESQIHSLFTLNLGFSLLLVIVCIIFPDQIAALLNTPELSRIIPPLSLIILLATFYNLPMAILRREMKFKAHAAVDLLQYIAVGVIMLTMSVSGYGIWSLVYAQIGGYLLSTIVLYFFTGWSARLSFDFKSLKGLYDYGMWEMVRYNLSYFESYASYFIVCNGINTTYLGLYDRASSFAALPDKIVRVQITAVLFSAFSRINYDRTRIISAFNKSLVLYAFIAIPVMLAIAIVSDDFVKLALGLKWVAMIPTMQILCLAAIFKMISEYFRNFNIANSNYKKQSLVDLALVSSGILFCVLGVQFGIEGVAYAIFISSVLAFIVNLILTCNSHNLSIMDVFMAILPASVGGLLMAGAMLFVKQIVIESLIIFILVQLIVGAVVLLLWIFKCPFESARQIIRETVFNTSKT